MGDVMQVKKPTPELLKQFNVTVLGDSKYEIIDPTLEDGFDRDATVKRATAFVNTKAEKFCSNLSGQVKLFGDVNVVVNEEKRPKHALIVDCQSGDAEMAKLTGKDVFALEKDPSKCAIQIEEYSKFSASAKMVFTCEPVVK